MLRGFYRNPGHGVKPDYQSFSDQTIEVINKMYLVEFISDNVNFDLRVLK